MSAATMTTTQCALCLKGFEPENLELATCTECERPHCPACWHPDGFRDDCPDHQCRVDDCGERLPHLHHECSMCEGSGTITSKCCWPAPVSRIECECGNGGGYASEECPDCEGTGYEDELEMGAWTT